MGLAKGYDEERPPRNSSKLLGGLPGAARSSRFAGLPQKATPRLTDASQLWKVFVVPRSARIVSDSNLLT